MNNKIEVLKRLYRNRYVKISAYSLSNISAEEMKLAKEVKECSYKIIPNFISTETTEMMRKKLDSEFEKFSKEEQISIFQKISADKNLKNGIVTKDGYRIWVDKNQSDKRIIDAQLLSKEFEDFFNSNFLKNIGSAFLNTNLKPNFAMANKTDFIANNLGSGGGWHRDNNYKYGFKGLVYLSDVTTENGPFQIIPKSSSAMFHLLKSGIPDKYQYTHQEITDMLQGENKIIDITGKAGTLVIFDINCIHRGKPIEVGNRYALTNYYFDY